MKKILMMLIAFYSFNIMAQADTNLIVGIYEGEYWYKKHIDTVWVKVPRIFKMQDIRFDGPNGCYLTALHKQNSEEEPWALTSDLGFITEYEGFCNNRLCDWCAETTFYKDGAFFTDHDSTVLGNPFRIMDYRLYGKKVAISNLDDDQDGVENSQDLCPSTPQEEAVNSNGCAESQLDEDQDGVIDALDHCPGTKELEVDANGCGVNAVNNKLARANLLYPNPATNYVTLAKTSNKEQIELFTATGVKLKAFSTQKGEDVEIDTSVLEKGLYLLKVGERVCRFVKE
jgi:hypothetical protein